MGFVLFATLNALAIFAAASVARRARFAGRAEAGAAIGLLWNFGVLAPIYALGYASRLTAGALAVASVALSVATIVACARDEGLPTSLSRTARLLGGIARLPIDALRATLHAGSAVTFVLLATIAVVAWTVYLAYLAPSEGWDVIWYHESIVGFAIQEHGFNFPPLPIPLQGVLAYPRACQMTNLWFSIFWDRRLTDAVNSVMVVPLLLTVFVLARRYSRNVPGAIGVACALVVMPGVLLELRSAYIDVHTATLLIIALHFCTRPVLRHRDALLGALALALVINAKSPGLVWAPPLALVMYARTLLRAHGRWRAALLTLLGCSAILVGGLALVYLQNWILFRNPLYPFAFSFPRLHLQFPGPWPTSALDDMKRPFLDVLAGTMAVPVPGHDFHDTQIHGYSVATPFLLVPLAALAFVRLAWCFLHASVLAFRGDVAARACVRSLGGLVVLCGYAVISAAFSPALSSARYNIQLPLIAMLLVHWMSELRPLRRVGEGLVVSFVTVSLIMMYWADPGWMVTSKQAAELAQKTPEERAATPLAQYSLSAEVARARERELGPGDITAFPDDIGFPAVLWNERYSNRLVWVPIQPDYLDALDAVNAKWAVASSGSEINRALATSPKWKAIGDASRNPPTTAYRRNASANANANANGK